jgi:hypothetical protein
MTKKVRTLMGLVRPDFDCNLLRDIMLRHLTVLLVFILSLSSCREENVLFSKLEEHVTGIDFVNENRETEKSNILTYE